MTQTFIKKNLALSLDFDNYVIHDPDILAKVPKGACIIITKKGDLRFNRESKVLAESVARGGEKCFEAHKEGKHWTVRQFAY